MDPELLKANPDIVRLNPVLQEAPAGVVRRKYGNVPTFYGGRNFASIKEAAHARDLDLEKKAGDVLAWFAQVPFPLAEGVTYVADFVVILKDWSVEVRDTKGFLTREFKLKRKLFKARYSREIVEV
jgi:hypothetical protein